MEKLNKIEIENRIQKIDDDLPDFFMVQLFVDDQPINFHEEPISNYDFWQNMLEQTHRALYRIKKNNPEITFDFSLVSKGEKDMRFINHLKTKYPNLDIDNIFELFDKEIEDIKPTGPDDNHPNPEVRFPIDSDLTKNVFISLHNKLIQK